MPANGLKLITADYQNLMAGRSAKEGNAISIALAGVEVDEPRSFQYTFPQHYGRVLGAFKRGNLFWMNYHWRVFRAKDKTAKLTITDWQNRDEPGGPMGQELIFNFVEVQPYWPTN